MKAYMQGLVGYKLLIISRYPRHVWMDANFLNICKWGLSILRMTPEWLPSSKDDFSDSGKYRVCVNRKRKLIYTTCDLWCRPQAHLWVKFVPVENFWTSSMESGRLLKGGCARGERVSWQPGKCTQRHAREMLRFPQVVHWNHEAHADYH